MGYDGIRTLALCCAPVPDPALTQIVRSLSQQMWKAVVRRDPCVWCGQIMARENASLDRILPGAAGGTYEWENVAGACRRCNSARHDMPILVWLLERRKLLEEHEVLVRLVMGRPLDLRQRLMIRSIKNINAKLRRVRQVGLHTATR